MVANPSVALIYVGYTAMQVFHNPKVEKGRFEQHLKGGLKKSLHSFALTYTETSGYFPSRRLINGIAIPIPFGDVKEGGGAEITLTGAFLAGSPDKICRYDSVQFLNDAATGLVSVTGRKDRPLHLEITMCRELYGDNARLDNLSLPVFLGTLSLTKFRVEIENILIRDEEMDKDDDLTLSMVSLLTLHRAVGTFGGRARAAEVKRLKKLKKEGKLNPEGEAKLERIEGSWKNLGWRGGRKSSSQWDQHFDSLVRYHEREGHCNIPVSHQEEGINLGQWLQRQRKMFKKGKLDESRRQRLEDLDVVWDLLADKWDQHFDLLVRYHEREGHCDVPTGHVTEDGINLSRWLTHQRTAFKEGKLEESRRQRLEDVGVVWDVYTNLWEQNFDLLVRYHEREGHCDVPKRHMEEGINLGTWLNRQRMEFKEGKLDELRHRQLEELGVTWAFYMYF